MFLTAREDVTVRGRTVTGCRRIPTAPVTNFARVWGPSMRSRTRRAGSARRPPQSTSAPASPRPATDTLLVDLDPQCNATVALGVGKDAHPNVYDCLTDGSALDPAVRRTSVNDLYLVPSSPDLAGANVELPRMPGLGAAAQREHALDPRRLLPDAARLPSVARPAHGQRAGRRRQGHRAGADRVLRARGARGPARHARPDPARAQPQVECCGNDPHDARRAHAPRPGRRA